MWYYFPPWLQAVSDYLSHTQLSLAIQSTTWMIPIIQSIHIACVCIVLGSYLIMDLRVLGFVGSSMPVASVVKRFVPWIWYALAVLLCTGSLLMIAEPGRDLNNPTFQLKMMLVVAISIVTYILASPLKADLGYWEASAGRQAVAKLIAIASLAMVVAIIFAGRWIAYTVVLTN
jgi:uncharacterized membrane protein